MKSEKAPPQSVPALPATPTSPPPSLDYDDDDDLWGGVEGVGGEGDETAMPSGQAEEEVGGAKMEEEEAMEADNKPEV